MAKNRRTKQQKTSARHNFQSELTINIAGTQTNVTIPSAHVSAANHAETTVLHAPSYAYVIADVRRTLLITAVLVVLDLVIFYLLKTKIVNIPTVGF